MSVTLRVERDGGFEFVAVTGITTTVALARFCRSLCGWSVFDRYPAVIVEIDDPAVFDGAASMVARAAVEVWAAHGRWLGFVMSGAGAPGRRTSVLQSRLFGSAAHAIAQARASSSEQTPLVPVGPPRPRDMRHVKMADAMADAARHQPAAAGTRAG